MIIVTAADSAYYTRLINLLGSLYAHCPGLTHLYVYDIGLTAAQLRFLQDIGSATGDHRLRLRRPEPVNPQITTKLRRHESGSDETAVGLYTWKPVAIKEALQQHPAILWLDAGITVLDNLDQIWDEIMRRGHFLTTICSIRAMMPVTVAERLQFSPAELAQPGINAAIQGIRNDHLADYVLPVYEWARDINNFRDDGTAPGGPTMGMFDQPLFSIAAARAGLVGMTGPDYRLGSGTIRINDRREEGLLIYHSRGDGHPEYYSQFLPAGSITGWDVV